MRTASLRRYRRPSAVIVSSSPRRSTLPSPSHASRAVCGKNTRFCMNIRQITMATLFEAYDAILVLGASAGALPRALEMRASFDCASGGVRPRETPWFEARSRAFWDDAVTTQGHRPSRPGRRGLPRRRASRASKRAHRGLFVTSGPKGSGETVLEVDLWGGAEFSRSRARPRRPRCSRRGVGPSTRDSWGATTPRPGCSPARSSTPPTRQAPSSRPPGRRARCRDARRRRARRAPPNGA